MVPHKFISWPIAKSWLKPNASPAWHLIQWHPILLYHSPKFLLHFTLSTLVRGIAPAQPPRNKFRGIRARISSLSLHPTLHLFLHLSCQKLMHKVVGSLTLPLSIYQKEPQVLGHLLFSSLSLQPT